MYFFLYIYYALCYSSGQTYVQLVTPPPIAVGKLKPDILGIPKARSFQMYTIELNNFLLTTPCIYYLVELKKTVKTANKDI